jgi:hypothetical protein
MSAVSSVGLNEFGGARPRELDCLQQLWHQRLEVGKPIRFRLKDNDGNWERIEILLKRTGFDRPNTSNWFAASASNSPFLIVAQPI